MGSFFENAGGHGGEFNRRRRSQGCIYIETPKKRNRRGQRMTPFMDNVTFDYLGSMPGIDLVHLFVGQLKEESAKEQGGEKNLEFAGNPSSLSGRKYSRGGSKRKLRMTSPKRKKKNPSSSCGRAFLTEVWRLIHNTIYRSRNGKRRRSSSTIVRKTPWQWVFPREEKRIRPAGELKKSY